MAVTFSADGRVGTITLDNPPANSYDIEFMRELAGAIGEANRSEARVVVLRSASEKFFSAGADVKRFLANDVDANMDMIRLAHEALASIARSPKLFVAFIAGHALGGGLEMALACDIIVAADHARFGLPEVTLGFNPAYGIARLLDVLGGGHGRDLLLTGRTLHATEALRIGLVNRVVAAPTLAETAASWAAEIAKSPREGLAATKQIVAAIRGGRPGGDPAAYGAALRTGAAARERIRAFVERKRRSR